MKTVDVPTSGRVEISLDAESNLPSGKYNLTVTSAEKKHDQDGDRLVVTVRVDKLADLKQGAA